MERNPGAALQPSKTHVRRVRARKITNSPGGTVLSACIGLPEVVHNVLLASRLEVKPFSYSLEGLLEQGSMWN